MFSGIRSRIQRRHVARTAPAGCGRCGADLLLYLRPTRAVRVAMKVFMAALNFWIAGVYYFIYCAPREHYDILALFWAVMGCIWIYDLAAGHDSLGRTGRHPRFALVLFCMPLVYPLFSLAWGVLFR